MDLLVEPLWNTTTTRALVLVVVMMEREVLALYQWALIDNRNRWLKSYAE